MRDDGRDAAHAIGSIDDRRFDGGVRHREVGQTLARARGHDSREEWLGWSVSGPEQPQPASEGCEEEGDVEVQTAPGVVVHGCGVCNRLSTEWQLDGCLPGRIAIRR